MITSALIYFGFGVATLILAIFPSSTGFPSEVQTAVDYIAGYVAILDPLFPIATMLQILTLVITFELAVFGFKGVKWIISHLPMVGGRG